MVPSGHVSTGSVTVAPGVAVPTTLTLVTPTTGLLGDNDPVNGVEGAVIVTLTVRVALNEPFAPRNWILGYVPGAVPAEVWIVNVACVDPFDGTLTDADGDQDAVDPGICDQFSAVRFNVPVKPPTLLTVIVKLAELPCRTDWLLAFPDMLKFPVPL